MTSLFPTRQVPPLQDTIAALYMQGTLVMDAASKGGRILIGYCASHMPSTSQCRNDVIQVVATTNSVILPRRAHASGELLTRYTAHFQVLRTRTQQPEASILNLDSARQQGSKASCRGPRCGNEIGVVDTTARIPKPRFSQSTPSPYRAKPSNPGWIN